MHRMASSTPIFHQETNMSMSMLLTYIQHLPPEDKIHLFEMIGVNSEEDLRYLVGEMNQRSEEELVLEYSDYRIHKILLVYIPPILLILGTFGNIFSFLIMRHKAMTRLSTYLFLAALSVADSSVLYIGLLRQWLGELTGFDIRDQANWLCKLIIIIGYICSDVSVWLIVAVTIERYIVVCYPLRAQSLCNVTRAKKAIAGLLSVFLAINLHFAWTVELNETNIDGNLVPKCDGRAGHVFLVSVVWPWVDALLYCFVPFIIISVFNLLIILRVVRATTGRGNLQHGCMKLRTRCNGDTNMRLTIMLLTVSFAFLLTTLPMNISIIASAFWNRQGHGIAEMTKFRLIMTISELLMYLNHSINFFLYCATGQKFRKEVIRMVCGKPTSALAQSDHSQHLYCSRACSVNGYHEVRKSLVETEV